MIDRISSSYEHALAAVYHKISKRGILTDPFLLQSLREEIKNELLLLCNKLTSNWNISVSVGPIKTTDTRSFGRSVNINSSSGANCLLNTLKDLGYVVPATRKKDKETGEYEFAESADQLTLMKMFAVSGDENLKHVLRIRKLAKMLGTYVNAKLHNNIFYSAYNPAATVTGRRGAHKTIFGYGGNAQTFPKHSSKGEVDPLAPKYLACLIARPGKIFFMCDQMSAEEWPVAALSGNSQAIKELSSHDWPENDRHTKLACFVFGKQVTDYTKKEWKDTNTPAGLMRYVGGKKPRHANNYGMRGNKLSEILAKEEFAFPPKHCDEILEKVHQFDPSVRNVFHVYIRNEINTKRMLRTPLGRERQFFGLRPNNPNYSLFNEAYAQIPQSTVGDNTGLSVLYLDENGSNDVIQESHDSLAQEVEDNINSLERSLIQTKAAFNRIIRFDNGFDINIPIEGEIGYNFKDTVKLKDMTVESLREAYAQLKHQTEATLVAQVS